jgi:hypothetical protein
MGRRSRRVECSGPKGRRGEAAPVADVQGDRAETLWRSFQEAVASTDRLLSSDPEVLAAPRSDPRRMALERCVESARAYGTAWKEVFLAGIREEAGAA